MADNDVHDFPLTSSDDRMHEGSRDCWCGPRVFRSTLGGQEHVVVHRGNRAPGGDDRDSGDVVRPFSELKDVGLLWLINRVVFHPRGFALGLVHEEDDPSSDVVGWRLLGDGSEVWSMGDGIDEDDLFNRVETFLRGAP